MHEIYISRHAYSQLTEYLERSGAKVITVEDFPSLGTGVSSHPDLMMCKMGAAPDSPIVFASSVPSGPYPENAAYCALVVGRYFIHRLDITAPPLMAAALKLGLKLIDLRQGYAKCSSVAVDDHSLITADPGMISALSGLPELQVLPISPGHVELPGYKCGFLGGASGRVGDTIIFNGDLEFHPDHSAIISFIEKRGLKVKYFPGFPLMDIGSIIESVPRSDTEV